MTATLAFSKGGFPNPMTSVGDLITGGVAGTPTRQAIGTLGQRLASNGTTVIWDDDLVDINFVIGNGITPITTGQQGYLPISQALTIVANEMVADQAGSIVVNLWKCTFAQFDAGLTHPVVADKITSATPPTIAAAKKSSDAVLTAWTKAIAADDILAYNVDSIATITRVTLKLKCRKAA